MMLRKYTQLDRTGNRLQVVVHHIVSCPRRHAIEAARFALAAVLALVLCSSARAQSQATVTVRPTGNESASSVLLIVDGKVITADALQLVRSQQVMIWVRDLEKLGWGTVDQSQPDRISFKGKNVVLTFTKGQDIAMVNSLSVRLAIDTYTRDGKFMVPLSFVAKALGYDYDLSIRPVALVTTSPAAAPVRAGNALNGRVIYNGCGVGGAVVRAVTPDFTIIKNARTKTDADGNFRIDGLADGAYKAYVYKGDNPRYFNRDSEVVTLKGGRTAQLEEMSLGQILAPLNPKSGAKIGTCPGGKDRLRLDALHGRNPLQAHCEEVRKRRHSR